MRIGGLVLLMGCSALIQPRMWHPRGWQADVGHLDCPSYAYPVVDVAFGAPMLTFGVAGAIVATEPSRGLVDSVVEGVAEEVAILALVGGALWTASSIYGFSNEPRCHRELRTASDVRPESRIQDIDGRAADARRFKRP